MFYYLPFYIVYFKIFLGGLSSDFYFFIYYPVLYFYFIFGCIKKKKKQKWFGGLSNSYIFVPLSSHIHALNLQQAYPHRAPLPAAAGHARRGDMRRTRRSS